MKRSCSLKYEALITPTTFGSSISMFGCNNVKRGGQHLFFNILIPTISRLESDRKFGVTGTWGLGRNNPYTGSLVARLQSSNKEPMYGLIRPPEGNGAWATTWNVIWIKLVLTLKGQCKPQGVGIILGESCSELLLRCTKWGF